MPYLYLALIAQIINAGVVLLDKFLLTSKSVVRPLVYVFYVSMLSGVAIFILPFGLILPPAAKIIWLSLAAGTAFTASIYFLYNSLFSADASDVVPVVGAVSALATLFFSFLFLKISLSGNLLMGFLLLVAGTILMSYFRFDRRVTVYVLLAGLFFALSAVLVKIVFLNTTFWNGFFWSRLGNVAVVLPLLFWPANRRAIWQDTVTSSLNTKLLILISKFFAGVAFFLVLLSIKLGNVSLVSAITGVQFVFLLLFALVFTKKFPDYFYESVHHFHAVVQKIVAVVLIVLGYFLLFV